MFNIKLYKEGLRRLIVSGVAISIILLTITALVPLLTRNNFIIVDAEEQTVKAMDFTDINSAYELAAPLYALMLLAPVMAYSMFDYLFKRKACDLFHAIPIKRITVFVSFLLAWLTWIVGIALSGVLLASLLWSLKFSVTVSFGLMVSQLVKILVSALFCSAFALVAIMIAGTKGTSIIFAISMFLYLPILSGAFFESLSYIRGFSNDSILFELFGWQNYLPLNAFPILEFFDSDSGEITTPNLIVSFVFVCLMTLLAGILYCRRKSEYAGDASPSKQVKIIIRTVVASIPVLIVSWILAEWAVESKFPDKSDTSLIIFTVVALLIWFIYELVTTKSIKKMLASVKTLWILPAIAVLFVGCVMSVKMYIDLTVPKLDEVESVSLNVKKSTYIKGEIYNLVINSDFVYVELDGEFSEDFTEDYQTYVRVRNNCYTGKYYITFNLKDGRKLYRTVSIPYSFVNDGNDYKLQKTNHEGQTVDEWTNSLADYIKNCPQYRRAVTDINIDKMTFVNLEIYNSNGESIDNANEIMKTFKEEYSSLSTDEKFELINMRYSSLHNKEQYVLCVYYQQSNKSSATYYYFVLSEKYTPKAFALAEAATDNNSYLTSSRIMDSIADFVYCDNSYGISHVLLTVECGGHKRKFEYGLKQAVSEDLMTVYKLLNDTNESKDGPYEVTLTQILTYSDGTVKRRTVTRYYYLEQNYAEKLLTILSK